MLVDRRPPQELVAASGSEDRVWQEYNMEHDYFISRLPLHKLRSCPKPTVAQVDGSCVYAGVLLSQAMDVVFAAGDALFLPPRCLCSLVWGLGPVAS